MSKLACRCGSLIVDQTDGLPHKAQVLSDQDAERTQDETVAAIIGYFATADRGAWAVANLGAHGGAGADAESAVHQILTRAALHHGRTLYECSACGRLWLQARPGENRWLSYSPDEPGERGVLRSADVP